MILKRMVAPGLLFYEYNEDDKKHTLVGVLDTVQDGIDGDEIADTFMETGKLTEAEVVVVAKELSVSENNDLLRIHEMTEVIDRLTTENKRLKVCWSTCELDCSRAHAEVERLNAVLEKISKSDGERNITTGEGHSDCIWLARNTLKGGEK